MIILKSKYIMKDVRSHHEFKKYAQTMIQVIKSTSLEIIQSQFLIIYNKLNVKFCYERIKTEQGWSFNQFTVNASEFSA